MKKSVLLSAFALVCGLQAFGASAVETTYKFADSSPMAEGKWVRISINSTGIYEITYDQLREMGFSDPSKVTMFGKGGAQQSLNFLSSSKRRIFEDLPQQMKVLHTNDKLIFYGSGTESMLIGTVGYQSSERYAHRRLSKNIYTDRTYYMLTDAVPVESVRVNNVPDKSSATDASVGYAYVYHEKDLAQGAARNGQAYWGENINPGETLTFDVDARYCVDGNAYLYTQMAVFANQPGTFWSKVNDGERSFNTAQPRSKFYTLDNDHYKTKLNVDDKGHGTAKITYRLTGGYQKGTPFAIDYWTLTYPISLKYAVTDPDFKSQYIGFKSELGNVWRHPAPEGCMAWDITDITDPAALDVENGYFYNNTNNTSQAIVFNPSKRLNTINPDWKAVPNQNLHGEQNRPIELLVITTEEFLPYAQRIAKLHEKYDRVHTLVATDRQIFDEFNGGMPDIMAFRALAKMIYQNPSNSLKNVLLVGPVHGDYRNVAGVDNRAEGLIGYQQAVDTFDKESSMVLDMYGCVTDYLVYPDNLASAPISLGVGVLPVTSAEEAENCIAKIGDYLSKEDFSGIVNEVMVMSCAGDANLHDIMSTTWAEKMQGIQHDNFNSELASGHLWIEGLGNEPSKRAFKESLKRGKLFSVYYGHAGEGGIAVISSADFMGLDNKEPGWMFTAACDVTRLDVGRHGIGDVGVLRSRHGLIGMIGSTREVFANENDALCHQLSNALFFDRQLKLRTSTPTMGEAYAMAKDRASSVAEQTYVLVGDPALHIPLPLGKISLATDRNDYRSGEAIKVTGKVLKADDSLNEAYNGYATVKLMTPERRIQINDSVPDIVVGDIRLMAVKCKVKNGEFTAKIPLGKEVDNYLATTGSVSKLRVLAGAYDPSTRLGTSGVTFATMAPVNAPPSEDAERDVTAPTVTVTYDKFLQTLHIEATDDMALYPGIGSGSGLDVTIDGNHITRSSAESPGVAVGNYSTDLSTGRLSAGRHIIRITATDIAGNSSEETALSFSITDVSPLRLTAETDYAIDIMRFGISGENAQDLTLVMTDLDGNVVSSTKANGTKAVCDVSDLEAGMYRAALRHNSPRGAYIYSNWVNFTIID